MRDAQAEPTTRSVDLDALEQISLLLASDDLPRTLTEEFFDRLLQLFSADAGSFFLLDDDGELWRAVPRGGQRGYETDLAEEAGVVVAAGRQGFVLPDTHDAGAETMPRKHLLAVPVRFGGKILGSLVLLRNAATDAFDQHDLGLATSIATQFGLSLERRRAEKDLARRVEEVAAAQKQLEVYAVDVARAVRDERERKQELASALVLLERTYSATVRGLAVAVEAKDEYTGGHLTRVTTFGLMLLRLVAPTHVGDPQFEYGFLLHDMGKLGIPDRVLRKRGPLTAREWQVMKQHPDIGHRILGDIPFLDRAREIVYSHHERWDGSGYPGGISGVDIPLGARLFAIVDAFDALTSTRPYRRAVRVDAALAEIARNAGTQFWPAAVDAFLSLPRDELDEVVRGRSLPSDRGPLKG